MTNPETVKSKYISMRRNEAEGTYEALRHYLNAFGQNGDAYGQAGIRAFRRANADEGYLWEHLWYGLNHQRIQVGDTVRRQSPNDEPEFMEAEVLDVTTFAAYLLDENGGGWEVWPLIHRMDRLHTEPDFDHTHHVPVQRHMGYDVQPEAAAEYEAILAKRGAAQPQRLTRNRHLAAVEDSEEGQP